MPTIRIAFSQTTTVAAPILAKQRKFFARRTVLSGVLIASQDIEKALQS